MSKRSRFLILAIFLAGAAFFLYPTFHWYFLMNGTEKTLVAFTKDKVRSYSVEQTDQALTQLLDLGKEKANTALPDEFGFLIDIAKKYYETQKWAMPASWTVGATLSGFQEDPGAGQRSTELRKALEDHYRNYILNLKKENRRIIQLGLDLKGGISAVLQADVARLEKARGGALSTDQRKEALDLAVEILKVRVDGFGVSEPAVRTDIENMRIYLDISGIEDPEIVNQLLISGGNLKLQIVDDESTKAMANFLQDYRQQNGKEWRLGDPLGISIPAGMQVRPYVKKDNYGDDDIQTYIVTKETEESVLDGTYITDADPQRDSFGQPTANFHMSAEGGERFRTLTRDNRGKSMAIVLANQVRAYATIREEIGGGQVQISGFSFEEAQAVAKVLRTGSLPLDLHVDSVQTVGASLGEDAIKAGAFAAAAGLIAVVIFMLLYYLGAGFVANIALLLNTLFVIAILSVLNLTLTLTSIAGLILTVGMAVDSNVIIFERIKDELRLGKSRASAVQTGYKKAFWTIVDAHVTTLIASVLLGFLGTGPIRGFAVTLTVGIITNLYTSLIVTRLIQDFSTEQLGHSKISIAWRLK